MRDTFNNLREEYLNTESSSSEDTLNISGSSLKQSRSFDDLKKSENDDTLLYNHTVNIKKSFCSLDDLLDDVDKSSEIINHEKRMTLKKTSDLQIWNSFDNLPTINVNQTTQRTKDRISAENLSEDSGYSDNICTNMKVVKKEKLLSTLKTFKSNDFDAYDCDVNYSFTNTNLGVSYHDLRLLGNYNNNNNNNNNNNRTKPTTVVHRRETELASSKNTTEEFTSIISDASLSSSEPDLLLTTKNGRRFIKNRKVTSKFIETYSVPKDLNLLSAPNDLWNFNTDNEQILSVAAKNLDLCDAFLNNNNNNVMAERKIRRMEKNVGPQRIFIPLKGRDSSSPETDTTPSFKREGNYYLACVTFRTKFITKMLPKL